MKNNALVVNGLTKRYTDFTLDGITFAVLRGSIVGLIGENGAGKSTTINALLGLIQKDAGTVLFLEKRKSRLIMLFGNKLALFLMAVIFLEACLLKKILYLCLRKS